MMNPRALLRALWPFGLWLVLGCASTATTAERAPRPTAALAAADPAPAPEPHPGRRGLTPLERQAIDQLASQAERVRGLTFVRPVLVEVHDGASIAEQLRQDLEEEHLIESRQIYTALGLLPDDVDLETLITTVLMEQVVGYYDPKQQRLVVRDDVMRRLGRTVGGFDEARVVMVHELVHALQDQRLGLGERMREERDSDLDTAYRSVVEGDATLAMVAYVAALQRQPLEAITQNPFALASLNGADAQTRGEALDQAPAILRVTLLAPYMRGLSFVATLHGSSGWGAVNDAHLRLPVSTEQVLHPEKYLAGELPDEVALPVFLGFGREGYTPLKEDTLGELELGVYLGQGRPNDVDEQAAAGWSGDRLRVYTHPTERAAVVWWTVWDSAIEAQEAEVAARRVSRPRRSAATPEHAHHVVRMGRSLLILRWVPEGLRAETVEAFRAFARGLPTEPPRGELPRGAVSPP